MVALLEKCLRACDQWREDDPFHWGTTPVSLARLRGEQGLYNYTCIAANAGQEQAATILGKLGSVPSPWKVSLCVAMSPKNLK